MSEPDMWPEMLPVKLATKLNTSGKVNDIYF